jgi:hypothetical protein
MMSGYAIGKNVWLVRTAVVAQEEVPTTLPIGSTILTPDEAIALSRQLVLAARRTKRTAA